VVPNPQVVSQWAVLLAVVVALIHAAYVRERGVAAVSLGFLMLSLAIYTLGCAVYTVYYLHFVAPPIPDDVQLIYASFHSLHLLTDLGAGLVIVGAAYTIWGVLNGEAVNRLVADAAADRRRQRIAKLRDKRKQ
jgi:hypothetical protein